MWAKGPMPGFSPKTELLAFVPTAVCQKKYAMCNITGYLVYPTKEDAKNDKNAMSSAGNAKDAWEKALTKIATYNVHTNRFELKEKV